jgi:hypothetical protein
VLLPNFWPTFFIKFLENPKIVKNNENPKKYVFNIFASFLAFSTSSKKQFKFSNVFWTRSTFHASFLKALIFIIESTLILLVFKKYKKNQNLQKKESWGTNFEAQATFYLKIWVHNSQKGGGNFEHLGTQHKKKTLKSRTFSSPSPKRSRRSSPF